MSSGGYDHNPLPTRAPSNSNRRQDISKVAIIILAVVVGVIFMLWWLKCRNKRPSNTPQSQTRLIREVAHETSARVDEHDERTNTPDINHHGGRQRARAHGRASPATHAGIRDTRARAENNTRSHPDITIGRNRIRTRAVINLINSTPESRSEPNILNQSGLPPLYDELERRKSLDSPQSPTPPSYEEFMAMPDKYSKCP